MQGAGKIKRERGAYFSISACCPHDDINLMSVGSLKKT
jgi:nitrite reductase/ring-hydroxylating ferredoxin subunit